jgi:hypothetical protein
MEYNVLNNNIYKLIKEQSLFLAYQHLNSGTNHECVDQCRFKVQVVPVFRFDVTVFAYPLRCFHLPQIEDHWSTCTNTDTNKYLKNLTFVI